MKHKGYWTKEKCKEEALKYNTRTEFNKKAGSAYTKAHKKHWLDEICSHMASVGNTFNRCIYAFEFSDNSVYIGLTYNLDIRKKEHFNDNKRNKSSVLKHYKLTNILPVLNQLTDYIDVNTASKLEDIKRLEYEKNGWFILNRSKCGTIGGDILIWTKEKCKEKALLYDTRGEFKFNYNSAYNSARKNKWLDEICSHMTYICLPNNSWTKDKCKKEALKYNVLSHFNRMSSGAYKSAKKNGWLDEICKHIKTVKNGIWQNINNCRIEALKYNNRTDFNNNC